MLIFEVNVGGDCRDGVLRRWLVARMASSGSEAIKDSFRPIEVVMSAVLPGGQPPSMTITPSLMGAGISVRQSPFPCRLSLSCDCLWLRHLCDGADVRAVA